MEAKVAIYSAGTTKLWSHSAMSVLVLQPTRQRIGLCLAPFVRFEVYHAESLFVEKI